MSSGLADLKTPFTTVLPELTVSEWYRVRRRRRRDRQCAKYHKVKLSPGLKPPEPSAPTVPTVKQIADTDNLLMVFEKCKREAGKAPGLDGLTYGDVGRSEMAAILRQVSRAIILDTYKPHPYRKVPIPKPGGGKRELKLRSIADRIVATALDIALKKFWESIFLDESHAWRPKRGTWTCLASLKYRMEELDYWVLVNDDVRKAFDNVVIKQVMADHAQYIQDQQLLDLIAVVLRGHEGQEKEVGIDQGNAYSPCALNVHLHNNHDLAFQQGHHLFWRYADNVVYLARNMTEGVQVRSHAEHLLTQMGLSLKGEDAGAGKGPIVNLREGDRTQLLGFLLSHRNNQLVLNLGKKAWDQLETNLEEAHATDKPVLHAQQVVRGWVNAYGPAFESLQSDDIDRVLKTAALRGFREVALREEMEGWWEESWGEWLIVYQREANHLKNDEQGAVGGQAPLAATPPGS